ncbi:hypothetical protein HN903_03700 [archaeon]|jgi:hypothetical protein|nr:hypothetical protein [archaeon]MBT7128834.1 hypothetical protein [archaeon]
MKKVLLHTRELSDVYALKTLEDYLVENTRDMEFCFNGGTIGGAREREVIGKSPFAKIEEKRDLGIFTLSDLSVPYDLKKTNSLGIDTALLKNFTQPLSLTEKRKLRVKYDLESDLPIITIGYASYDEELLKKFVTSFYKRSKIILVASYMDTGNFSKTARRSLRIVKREGVLRDYFSMADINLSGYHFGRNAATLNNFVESSEGGPFFIFDPANKGQYGYKELVASNNIREHDSFDSIMERVSDYIKNLDYETAVKHKQTYARHIYRTRQEYLPQIADSIIALAHGKKPSLPKGSGLDLKTGISHAAIMHKDTTNFKSHL